MTCADDLAALQAQYENLKTRYQEAEDTIQNQKDQLADARSDNGALIKEVNQLSDDKDRLTKQVQDLQKQGLTVANGLMVCTNAKAALQKQLDSASAVSSSKSNLGLVLAAAVGGLILGGLLGMLLL